MDGLSLKPAPGPLALVQGFVNTRNIMHGYDLLESADGATAWLSERGLIYGDAQVSDVDRRRLVAFREGLRGLLLAHNDDHEEQAYPADVKALNEIATTAPLQVRFDPGGEPRLGPAAKDSGVEGAMGAILAVAVRASDEGTWRRLKACRNEGCLWAFYDSSKNRSGSWCTMDVCGARHKMRAYRRRKDDGP